MLQKVHLAHSRRYEFCCRKSTKKCFQNFFPRKLKERKNDCHGFFFLKWEREKKSTLNLLFCVCLRRETLSNSVPKSENINFASAPSKNHHFWTPLLYKASLQKRLSQRRRFTFFSIPDLWDIDKTHHWDLGNFRLAGTDTRARSTRSVPSSAPSPTRPTSTTWTTWWSLADPSRAKTTLHLSLAVTPTPFSSPQPRPFILATPPVFPSTFWVNWSFSLKSLWFFFFCDLSLRAFFYGPEWAKNWARKIFFPWERAGKKAAKFENPRTLGRDLKKMWLPIKNNAQFCMNAKN